MKIDVQLISQLQRIFIEQKESSTGSIGEFEEMSRIVKLLRETEVNKNFVGTLQEIHAYVNDYSLHEDLNEHVQHHQLNISRWIEELSMLQDGGGAVTIDYKQRMGREI